MSASTRTRLRAGIALAGGLALVALAGCADKTAPAQSTGQTLKVGPGVTDTTITLGVLTDRTGPYAAAGKSIEAGRTLFWQDKKVCGRGVAFTTKDHQYTTQGATTAYAEIKDNVLALDELLGSPEIAALQDSIKQDQMLTIAASWSSALLANPYVVISGTTYDVEIVNGLYYLTQHLGIARGDKVGYIYDEGEFGENGLAGGRAAAKEYGLQLVEQKVPATAADMTAQVTALKAAGVKAIVLTTSPPQTASAVGVAAATGLAVPFLANFPSFSPALLGTAAGPALHKSLLIATSLAPFTSDVPGAADVRAKFLARYPDQPKLNFAFYGYAQGQIMYRILDTACKNNDLSRAGLLKAFQSLRSVDSDGLIATLDFSKPGAIPARQIYIVRPDASVAGGLALVQDLFAAPLATSYQPAS